MLSRSLISKTRLVKHYEPWYNKKSFDISFLAYIIRGLLDTFVYFPRDIPEYVAESFLHEK
jgi:hypothetical protein